MKDKIGELIKEYMRKSITFVLSQRGAITDDDFWFREKDFKDFRLALWKEVEKVLPKKITTIKDHRLCGDNWKIEKKCGYNYCVEDLKDLKQLILGEK